MSLDKEHINQVALAELKNIMEDDFTLLVETFLTDSDMRITSLNKALSSRDSQLFAETAHSFKGSSLNVCATHLSELCQSLETIGRENQLEEATGVLSRVQAEYELVSTLLKEFAG